MLLSFTTPLSAWSNKEGETKLTPSGYYRKSQIEQPDFICTNHAY